MKVTLSKREGNGANDVSGRAWDEFEFDFDIFAKSVRLTAKSVYTHGNNGIAEIEFYGTQISKFSSYALFSSFSFIIFVD